MNISNLCTFIMPVRIDSEERLRNFNIAIEWLKKLNCKIFVLEADCKQIIDEESMVDIDYQFVKDENPLFHRTKYINILLKKTNTKVVSVWDADIIVKHSQIITAIDDIVNSNYTLAFPYKENKFIMLSEEGTKAFISSKNLSVLDRMKIRPLFNRPLCGGAFCVNRDNYLLLGGENENFIGWGPEDTERLKRVQIMDYKVKWDESGFLYHLNHPRNQNSFFYDDDTSIIILKELIKICSMNKIELTQYINNGFH